MGAGKTAAYLIEKTLGNHAATILTTQSDKSFVGETDREKSFEAQLKKNRPKIKIIKIKGGGGLEQPTENLVYKNHAKSKDFRWRLFYGRR